MTTRVTPFSVPRTRTSFHIEWCIKKALFCAQFSAKLAQDSSSLCLIYQAVIKAADLQNILENQIFQNISSNTYTYNRC